MNSTVSSNEPSFRAALMSSWALLLGFGILMLGDGLQATLLAVRADQEGFATTLTGLVMSSFFVGFLGGSIYAPRIMTRVGHIRVFAAFAALASAAILVHAVFVDVYAWMLLRFISGFCFAGLYVVAESWLNDSSTNETRGKVLSMYMVVTYVGVALGQLFLNLADPMGYPLFILTSVLISVAVVPLLLSGGPAPHFENTVQINLAELFRISPLGVVGMFAEGLITASFFALAPIYGQRIGLDIANISFFMTAAVVGAVVFQWPLGALSDRFDRRVVLTVLTVLASFMAVACLYAADESLSLLLITAAVFGGLSFPLYAICIAHSNDHLKPEEMIAASAGLVLVGGIGAVLGPLLIAIVMDYLGDNSFFWSIAVVHALVGVFAIFRMLQRPPPEGQSKYTPGTIHPSMR